MHDHGYLKLTSGNADFVLHQCVDISKLLKCSPSENSTRIDLNYVYSSASIHTLIVFPFSHAGSQPQNHGYGKEKGFHDCQALGTSSETLS